MQRNPSNKKARKHQIHSNHGQSPKPTTEIYMKSIKAHEAIFRNKKVNALDIKNEALNNK